MPFEDKSPIDFLFGNFDKNSEEPHVPFSSEMAKKLDFKIIFVGLFYYVTILMISFQLVNFVFDAQNLGILFIGSFILIFLSAWKSIALLDRYGPDLKTRQSGLYRFVGTQLLISYSLCCSIITLVGYLSYNYTDGFSIFSIFIVITVFSVFYIRILPEIGIVSASLGIGIIPSWGGVKRWLKNVQTVISLSGKKSPQLAILRLFVWSFSLFVFSSNFIYYALPLVGLVFLILFYRWETSNASSLLMKIRAIIHTMSPSFLPIQKIEPPGVQQPVITKQPMVPGVNPALQPTSNKQTWKSYIQVDNFDPTKFAARSLKRIADEIKQEHHDIADVRYCAGCGKVVVTGDTFCTSCTARQSQSFAPFDF